MNAYYMPEMGLKEQEQLYKEGISLKQERNAYQQENLKLRTKVAMLENDLKRKITLVNQLSIQPSLRNEETEGSFSPDERQLKNKIESKHVQGLKGKLKEL